MTAGSSLIALDATNEQSSSCAPPGDMIKQRQGHQAMVSGGNLYSCGGKDVISTYKDCEEFDKEQGDWIQVAEEFQNLKQFFPKVPLDGNRVWIGRKLESKRIASLHFFRFDPSYKLL